jgi:hypothetical protein
MSDQPDVESPPRGRRHNREAAIRSTAFGALVAGGLCLYFGLVWSADAPASASPQATEMWYFVDHVFQWWLRIIGVGFLAGAGLSAMGNRLGALVTAADEAAFALLMLAMAVNAYLEARAMGVFDATVILFGVLLVVGLSAARYSWSAFLVSRPAGHEQTS